ncbi:LCP family protein [Nocardioides caricicola]|uniref:LCP family protein n=1 Tax=Nocardioides caricicola TaxID=634770 RepID=A0ABW0MXD5_9ACTN
MATRLARTIRRGLVALVVCVALTTLLAVTAMGYLHHRIDEVDRIDGVFDDLGPRPERVTTGPAVEAINVLLLGTDRRSEVATTGDAARAADWVPGAQRSDAMMLVHISADRDHVLVVSLPRDSWVEVPGHGMAKINAAFSWGGPSLAVQTVEGLTDVRIDHVAVIDWEGFRELTDAVGGVTVEVPQTVHDSARGVTWTAGEHLLDGQEALDYVGQRYGLPGGDLDRVRRQQAVLATLAEESLELRRSPTLVLDFVGMMTRHVSVDDDWSTSELTSLAWSLRGVGADDVQYLTAPVSGVGWAGDQSVVWLDHPAGAELWRAIKLDQVDRSTGRNGSSDPSSGVR